MIYIKINKEDKILIVQIKNDFPDLATFDEVTKNNNRLINLHKLSTEGKSGFHKADKIIRSDLKNETNSYQLFIDEGRFTIELKISIDNLTT